MSKTIEEYMQEMMRMYSKSIPIQTGPVENSTENNLEFNSGSLERPIGDTERQPFAIPTEEGFGSIIAVVSGGNQSIPLKNSTVTVYDSLNGDIIRVMTTDESGKTPITELRAPSKIYSLDRQSTTIPYALYDVTAEAENYVTQSKRQVAVFDGIMSIQQFNLVWDVASGGEGEV